MSSSPSDICSPDTPLRGCGVRYAPTPLHPTGQINIRRNFKSFHEVATVVVGGEHYSPDSTSLRAQGQTTYKIHKDLLTAESPFFSAALNGAFAEGLDQTVQLPEEKPEIFEWFLWWLYTGSLTTPDSTSCEERPAQRVIAPAGQSMMWQYSHPSTHTDGDLRNSAGSPKYFLLLDLYALSDKLMTTKLCNHIVDTVARLSENTNSVPTPSDTWILYDTIRDNAPMRRLALDLFAYKKTDKLLESHKDEWHPRFLRELVVKLKRPGFESLDRHTLTPWRPSSWQDTKACEICRNLLKPGLSSERCSVCDRAFCKGCASGGRMPNLGGEIGACKPWLKGMCSRYHEHAPGESRG